MVLPTFAVRALLALSTLALPILTLALPILTLPTPNPKSGSSIAKRAVTHHVSELNSNWDDAGSWEPHSGWYSYNEDSADWNDDDSDDDDDEEWDDEEWDDEEWDDEEWDDEKWDDEEWDVEEYDYDGDHDYEHDDDNENYNDYEEEWDDDDNAGEWEDEEDEEGEWGDEEDEEGEWGDEEDEEGEWDDEEDEEGEWESDDEDDDEDGQVYYDDWDEEDDDEPSYDNYSPAKPASYSPHHVVLSGIGTVYTQDGYAGSCGNHHDDSAFIAALGNSWMHHQYKSSECGRQIQVTNKGSHYHVGGEGNTITVTIQDTCASCDDGHVDFSHAAWDALTDGSPQGQIDLEWSWL
ncbi:RlpA-like double-psi beta-barrel-protein domain-containing protein-containing protein [Triangularia verruculosa]|uniref:RlpA-like double-psi beta-barrel-protein domain-containing protein-containing protein n=1 Tax=Triangularia verruculosa TaxID=2587418 RepID=A0AAN6XHT3_9PEZI|nr:RlpA-like double-psi beta-barrel-protein domain-containing protein-containing protein [Triangularia verruculosa]